MSRRFTPADFGAPPDDAWIEPDDDLVDFLRDDPEVDWTNKWVRRGARDEMAGLPQDANPYARPGMRNSTLKDFCGWRDGWMASGHYHGYFNRTAYKAWREQMNRFLTTQFLPPLGHFADIGEQTPEAVAPEFPRHEIYPRQRNAKGG
ncbi:MAG: hypothetical protein LCH78_10905 [Proteobacteria bacterium]|nr:hypothetical protein [Pseudomonadota bacterium]